MESLHLPADDDRRLSFRKWSVQTSLAHLDLPVGEATTLGRLLSFDERERAARFVHERDARRYTVARATFRQLLGRCLGADPQTIEFQYGANGKPSIDGPLHFNVSHSDSTALFALSLDGPVGCDLERLRPMPEPAIVSRWFAPAECERDFEARAENDRHRACGSRELTQWTATSHDAPRGFAATVATVGEMEIDLAP